MKTKECNVSFEEGIFRDIFLKFIQYKQGLGFKYGREAQSALSRINTQLNFYCLTELSLSKAMVESLASRQCNEAPATQIKRICYLRHFAEFLQDMGYNAYSYPKYFSVVFHDSFAPYIFTIQQISDIINVADLIEFNKCSPLYYLVWPAFIRVLYCCGLRLSEALDLKLKDVDLDLGCLYIEKSKNGTSRYVPLSGSLQESLNQYARNMEFDMDAQGYFFPAPDGGHYAATTARWHIKKLYQKAGIPETGNGGYPRIHDLRHSFSCHALEQMQQKGFDLYYSLPILSAFLGHQGIRDTERYLRLPYFQYQSIIDMEFSALGSIIPEVSDYEEA